jgi:hypothetical protein
MDGQFTALLPQKVLRHNPELPKSEGKAGEHHKLGEIAPRHVMVLRPVNREILSPARLLLGGAPVGRD